MTSIAIFYWIRMMPSGDKISDRRRFLTALAATGAGVLLPSLPLFAAKSGVRDVPPIEDLMREHGGLNRILLIYEEVIRRLEGNQALDVSLLRKPASLIHDFIEGYHEKLEEEFIFPRLKKAGRLGNLVDVLKTQHDAGKQLTGEILKLATDARLKTPSDRKFLEGALKSFIRMYRPHEAREDTVVFPEFKKIISPKEYNELGERFEDREHQLFGKEGFDGVVSRIAELEKALGIYDLSQFTPKAPPKTNEPRS